ncbi:MAG TPA: GIY-YIG nuclease family protein [Candidatus Limnocylindrales bacterium]|nr:GIY-YIG nuclease family protein [Candidatus Limnocylindrales bacterium]
MIYSPSKYSTLPEKAGVYIYSDRNNKILYVGKANNLRSRVSSYFVKSAKLGEKTRMLVEQVVKIRIIIVESELEALLLEAFYIKKYRPKYNIRLSDDKSYVRIRITIKDKYPVVMLARREDDSDSIYFGPYPNSWAVKLVLKTIRKVFPYQSAPNHPRRICLYNHLGLCPCPPIFDCADLRKNYKKNIKGIIRILEAQSSKILQELEKKRDILSKNEIYEEANLVQKKINALRIITEPFHKPFEYDVNPNLRIDLRKIETDELRNQLNENGMNIHTLHRIECYDISNTQGTHATGSMVVFTEGEKDSSQYRRFKIKKDGIPNDFAMMEEMLTRRFKRDGWEMPSLVIVDGGKGQITSAMKALVVNNITVPLIGLAKREETIIIPTVDNFKELSLPKNSKSLHLVMRIRDEAHRFAITYHRLLRSKSSFE